MGTLVEVEEEFAGVYEVLHVLRVRQELRTEHRVNERVVRLKPQIAKTSDLLEDRLGEQVVLTVEVAVVFLPLLTSSTNSLLKAIELFMSTRHLE